MQIFSYLCSYRITMALILGIFLTACAGNSNNSENGGQSPIPTQQMSLQITGNGKVQSSPAGIDCTNNCNAQFISGSSVTLTAIPSQGQVISSWGGACSGSSQNCVVNMSQARAVSISFTPTSSQSLNIAIVGSGSISSQPSGINCASNCSSSFPNNTQVILTATPNNNYVFSGWTGACGGTNTCIVNMNQTQSVTATFTTTSTNSFPLNVTLKGNGSVQSAPSGINCGTTCNANFPANTSVTLTAVAAQGYIFNGWGGACVGNTPTCTVSMNQARSSEASFIAQTTSSLFQSPQLLESSNDFNVASTNLFATANMLVAVNTKGDGIVLWEQSDGVPNGDILKVFSRRYNADSGWQAATVVPNLNTLVKGFLFLDDKGVATWIRPSMETYRHSSTSGWSIVTKPTIPSPSYNEVTSAVMDASGNIGVIVSGGDVYNVALAAGGQWGTLVRVNTGTRRAINGQVALSSNGSAIAIWQENNIGDSYYSIKVAHYDPAKGWGAPTLIESDLTDVTRESTPRIVVDAQGNGIAMWQQGANNSIRYNVYRADSGWQGERNMDSTGDGNDLGNANIQLLMSPDGRAVATWSASCLCKPPRQNELRSMQYTPSSGWSAPVTVDTGAPNRVMQMDNNNQVFVIYSPIVSPSNPKFDLVYRKLILGSQWSSMSLLENGAGDIKKGFRFAMNTNGKGIAIWAQDDSASTSIRNSLWSSILR